MFTRPIAVALLASLGCSSESAAAGRGTVAFSTWGEEFIEQGIPADELEDGWSIRFSRFLIVVREVRVADAAGAVGAVSSKPRVFDMVKPGVKPVARFAELAAKPWTHVSFQIGPMSADAELGDGATEADKKTLLDAGASVHVEGTATRAAGSTKSFAWTFPTATLYDRCAGERDGKPTEGVLVTNGGTDDVQLTIHGDHFFYDDLQASNAKLRFNAIAGADADLDGRITLEELAAVRLTSIAKEDGAYGTGAAANVNTLRDFVGALSRTLGHFRGEGECFARDPAK